MAMKRVASSAIRALTSPPPSIFTRNLHPPQLRCRLAEYITRKRAGMVVFSRGEPMAERGLIGGDYGVHRRNIKRGRNFAILWSLWRRVKDWGIRFTKIFFVLISLLIFAIVLRFLA